MLLQFLGKGQFGGRLGKALQALNPNEARYAVGKFTRIPCEDFPRLPVEVERQLSQDNKTLYRLCIACIDG